MKSDYPVTKRVSLGFSDREWEDLERALVQCHKLHPEQKGWGLEMLTSNERNWFMRKAIWAFAKAIIRQAWRDYVPLACDVRHETEDEMAERMGKLPPAGPGGPPAPQLLDLQWLKQHFPNRWN
jgi:hypothetical protein